MNKYFKVIGGIKYFLIIVLVLFSVSLSQSATRTWTGASCFGNTSWTTAANWGGGCVLLVNAGGDSPDANDDVIINTTVTITNVPTLALNSLSIGAGVTVTLVGAAGSVLTINNSAANPDLKITGTLIISTNLSLTMAAGATASIAGQLTINSGRTFTSNAAGTITTVTGIVYNSGTVSSSTSGLVFNNGSAYRHNTVNAVPSSTWNSGSTCEILGGITTMSIANNGIFLPSLSQSFHHFKWNVSAQTQSLNLMGYLTTVNGDMTIAHTNSNYLSLSYNTNYTLTIGGSLTVGGSGNNANLALVMNNNANSWTGNMPSVKTIDVTGNLNVSPLGILVYVMGTQTVDAASGNVIINVNGNFNFTSLLTGLNMQHSAVSSQLNIKGNFFMTVAGILQGISSGTGTATIQFNGSSVQSITHTLGSISNTNVIINNPAGVIMADALLNSLTIDAQRTLTLQSGTFTIKGGAYLNTPVVTLNDQVIVNCHDGRIVKGGGMLAYQTGVNGATVNYSNISSDHTTGDELIPSSGEIVDLNINVNASRKVILNSNVTINRNLAITSGTFNFGTGSNTINIGANATVTAVLDFGGTNSKIFNLTGDLSGTGTINMTGIGIGHEMNLNGVANAITLLNTTTNSGSTVRYNRTGNQNVFASSNYQNVTVSGGTKTISSATVVNGILTLTSGSLVSNGNLTVNLNTGAISGTGTGVLTGNVTLLKTASSAKYHYISSPISGLTVNAWNDDVTIHTGPQYLNLFTYDETNSDTVKTEGWEPVTSLSTSISPMAGYALYFRGLTNLDVSGSYDHSASFSNTSLTNTVSSNDGVGNANSDGWHLIGNPYPSALDWEVTSGWTKINVDAAIYFWDPVNSRHSAYVGGIGINGATQFIPSMQAFWLKVTTPGGIGELHMNNDARVTNANPSLWRAASTHNILKLKASSGIYNDEMIVRFMEGAEETFDNHADAYKRSNSENTPSMYTVYGGKKYGINSLPESLIEKEIPVKIDVGFTGTYTISADEIGVFASDDRIFLEDRLLGIKHDLRSKSDYVCQIVKGDTSARFFIKFNRESIKNKDPFVNDSYISVRGFEQTIIVAFNNVEIKKGTIAVYNTLGQKQFLVESEDINSNEYRINLPSSEEGIYMVKVNNGDFTTTKKVYLHR